MLCINNSETLTDDMNLLNTLTDNMNLLNIF
jgi:hypothetical protein